ncbi:hypothetical protein MBLNU230_g2169t1 [Neophaeotheca triangularis]
MKDTTFNRLNFNIDHYLDPYIPPNLFAHLPRPIAHCFGYRDTPHKEPPALVQWVFAFIGTFIGILLVGGTYAHAPLLDRLQPPPMIASLGASAILDYNAVRSPLAQPRNVIFGHVLCAIVGVCISKLFQLSSNFDEISWVAGAVSTSLASVLMSATGTVHPPGGATALLACTSAEIRELDWMFIPLILLGSIFMLIIALMVNNIARQYPVYWWSPQEVGQKWRRRKVADEEAEKEIEKEPEQSEDTASSKRSLQRELSNLTMVEGGRRIILSGNTAEMPDYFELSSEEVRVLEALQTRLSAHDEVGIS